MYSSLSNKRSFIWKYVLYFKFFHFLNVNRKTELNSLIATLAGTDSGSSHMPSPARTTMDIARK